MKFSLFAWVGMIALLESVKIAGQNVDDPKALGKLVTEASNIEKNVLEDIFDLKNTATSEPMPPQDDLDKLNDLETAIRNLRERYVSLKERAMGRIEELRKMSRNDKADQIEMGSEKLLNKIEEAEKLLEKLKMNKDQMMMMTMMMMIPTMKMDTPATRPPPDEKKKMPEEEVLPPMPQPMPHPMPMPMPQPMPQPFPTPRPPPKPQPMPRPEEETRPETITPKRDDSPQPPVNFFQNHFREKMKLKLSLMKAFRRQVMGAMLMKANIIRFLIFPFR